MRISRATQIVVGAIALLSVAVSAQNNRAWSDPYQDAVKLIQANRYQEALQRLEVAIKANPKAELNKLVEGVFRIDYVPYYWLGIAYFELHSLDKARENFEKAKSPAPRDRALVARFNDYQAKLQAALAVPKGPTVNAAFEPALQRAESAFDAKRFADALSGFDAAKSADAAEYTRRNVQARRDEAARAFALQLDEEGRRALGESLNSARAKFQQAEQTFGGLRETSDGLAEVKKREDQYQQARSGAERDINAGNFKAARDKLNQARSANPEQFNADNLSARVSAVNSRLNAPPAAPPVAPPAASSGAPTLSPAGSTQPGAQTDESRKLFENGRLLAGQFKYTEAEASYTSALQKDANNLEARDALDKSRTFAALVKDARSLKDKPGSAEASRKKIEEARIIDPARFAHEGLNTLVSTPLAATGDDPLRGPLRAALVALLRGDAQASISILEPVSQHETGNTPNGAALHAYLGVAYATRALSSAKPDEQTRLRNDALAEFRLALSAQRDYQLSPRIVSPKILAIFEQARVPR